MATVPLLDYDDMAPEARAVIDDIKAARGVDDVNNFWKALAHQPDNLRRIWEGLQEVMAPGALDTVTKEMLYLAVSVANNCEYCAHSHTASARAKGMTDEQYGELLAIVAMASQTNALANALRVPVDDGFLR
ncbi:MAG: carboxymuconolactone decarboxylase family protein [Acidimicrobiia bacterium]|nr:carboxymuconolactone decarboxylase family protein [Acidimicrobiia bacterium]